MEKPELNVFWFRRDLRLSDNHGLYNALTSGKPVLPVFIFDTQILDKLDRPFDLRVQFIHETLAEIHHFLVGIGSGLPFSMENLQISLLNWRSSITSIRYLQIMILNLMP